MKQSSCAAGWQTIRERIDREAEIRRRESEIATCECGGQVRRDASGVWVHAGECAVQRKGGE